LGNKTNVGEAARKAEENTKKSDSMPKEIIEINSDSETNISMPLPFAMPKAAKLAKLTVRASDATNNLALAGLVREFIEALRSNSSKTLTKDASHFLDVLHKQLADPSVFATPLRWVLNNVRLRGLMV